MAKQKRGEGASPLSLEYHQYKRIQSLWDKVLAKVNCHALRLPYFDLAEAPGKDVETPDRHPLQVAEHSSHAMRFRMSTSLIRHVLKNVEKDRLPLDVYAFGPIFFRDESPVPRHSEKFTYLNLGYSNFQSVVGVIHTLDCLLSAIGMTGYTLRLNDLSIINAFLSSLPVDPFIRNIVLFHLHEIKELKSRKQFEEYLAEGFGLKTETNPVKKKQESLPSNEILSAAMNMVLSEMDLPTHPSRGHEEIVQNVLKKFERKRSLHSLLERFDDLRHYLLIKAGISHKSSLKDLEKAARSLGVEKPLKNFLEFAGMVARLPRFSGSIRLDTSLSAWSIFYDKAIFRVDLDQKDEGAVFGLGGSSDTVCGAVSPGHAVPTTGFTLDMDMLASCLNVREKGEAGEKFRNVERHLDFLIIPMSTMQLIYAYRILDRLVDAGFHAQLELGGYPLKDALKRASRMGAKRAIIVGEGEEKNETVILRDMKGNKQQTMKLNELLNS